MSEKVFTHYKYPNSPTSAITQDTEVQSYFRTRGPIVPSQYSLPPSYMEISLDAYRHNLSQIQNYTSPDSPAIIPVVKYNYMGMGGPLISQLLVDNGVARIGMATPDELRDTHREVPDIKTLMLYPLQSFNDLAYAIEHDSNLTVESVSDLNLVQKAAQRVGKTAHVHVQVETGFNHFGVKDELLALFDLAKKESLRAGKASATPDFNIVGISSHFATAGSDNSTALIQFENFLDTLRCLHDNGHSVDMVHIANSAAMTELPQTWQRSTYAGIMPGAQPAIRPGEAIYGIGGDNQNKLGLKPALTAVVSHISSSKTINTGDSVGYCGVFKTDKPMEIAVVPIGWGSGYGINKTASEASDDNQTHILINGVRSPVLGLVGSSSFVAENRGKGAKGDTVLLIENEGTGCNSLPLAQVAEENGMISSMLSTQLGKSLPHAYYEG